MKKKYKFGIIGRPLSHSFSPGLFSAVGKTRGLDILYETFELGENDLDKFFNWFKGSDLTGINVTVPFKEKAIDYLAEVDGAVGIIGAVNVIKNDAGHLSGFNTDWMGFKNFLEKIGCSPEKALIFGGGGACRAVLYSLHRLGCRKAFVVVRSVGKGMKLTDAFQQHLELELVPWDEDTFPLISSEADLFVNATPLGLDGFPPDFPNLERLCLEGKVLVDLIYNPPLTDFMQAGRRAGASVYNGVDMLLFQALEAFKIWTGIETSYEEWRKGYEVLMYEKRNVGSKEPFSHNIKTEEE